jgi:hypothetical protein
MTLTRVLSPLTSTYTRTFSGYLLVEEVLRTVIYQVAIAFIQRASQITADSCRFYELIS